MVEPGGGGAAAGLRVADVVAMVDAHVCTVLSSEGMVEPRCPISSAIDPRHATSKLLVYDF